MAYIWEEYSETKRYSVGTKICPYMEVFCNTSEQIEVNPMLRFSHLFDLIESNEFIERITDKKEFENVLIHYLAQLDKYKGMNYRQALIEIARMELEAGYYGETCRTLWNELIDEDRECLLYVIVQKICNDTQNYFMDAIGKAFPMSSLCYENKTEQYYLYLAAEKTDYNLNKFRIIQVLFWDITQQLKVIWESHYGIIGIEDTMHIESIQIV